MAANPRLILLDEPTAGLTRGETVHIARLVHLLAERASVIVVEHDMEFIRQLESTVTVLHRGRVLASGSMEEVRGDARVLDVYLGRDLRAAVG
jgi:ABC-type uncharacterized transport system ATPase subunit